MKNKLVLTTLLGLSSIAGTAHADPAFLLGGTVRFGGGTEPAFGLTAKVISDDKQDEAVAGLGVSWFPGNDQPLGLDISGGYLFDDTAAMLGYDFLARAPSFSLGYVDTDDDNDAGPVPGNDSPPSSQAQQ